MCNILLLYPSPAEYFHHHILLASEIQNIPTCYNFICFLFPIPKFFILIFISVRAAIFLWHIKPRNFESSLILLSLSPTLYSSLFSKFYTFYFCVGFTCISIHTFPLPQLCHTHTISNVSFHTKLTFVFFPNMSQRVLL